MKSRPFISEKTFSYPIKIELGLIISLCLLLVTTHIQIPEKPAQPVQYAESDEAALVLPSLLTEQATVIKAPRSPEVPITKPDDTPVEAAPLSFPEFERNRRMAIPRLAKEIEVKVDYDKLSKIEVLPEMIGGEDAFRKSIEYPDQAREAGIEGIVEVEFTVDEHGRVLQPVITRGIGGGCDRAVLEAIKIQRYKPGKKQGKVSQFKIKETVQFILLGT